MIYFDTSALIKRYLAERGSDAVQARFDRAQRAGERVFASALTYAEILTALGRKLQSGDLSTDKYEQQADGFTYDWIMALSVLEVDTRTMSSLRSMTARFSVKSADAVHLSAALWLRDMSLLVPDFAAGDKALEFAVADQSLARIAVQCGLAVFNPESA
jgi:predicted nucleic acid-binding protein